MLRTGIWNVTKTNRIQTKSALPVRTLSRPLAANSSLVSHGSCFIWYNHCLCPSFHNLLFLSSFQLSPQQERKRDLTVWSKVCFAIGGAPYQITGTALGFFLQIFLLDVALVSIHMGTQRIYTARPQHILIIKINWLSYHFSY